MAKDRGGGGKEEGGRLISLTGLTQGDQRWIETHITHTSSHDTGDQWRCLSTNTPCCLCTSYTPLLLPCSSICLLGEKTTKASLAEYMLNTSAPGFVCVIDSAL